MLAAIVRFSVRHPGLVVGLALASPTLDGLALRSLVETGLRPQLLAVRGVADVNVFGGELRQQQVQVDVELLSRSGLTLPGLAHALSQATGLRPGGFMES